MKRRIFPTRKDEPGQDERTIARQIVELQIDQKQGKHRVVWIDTRVVFMQTPAAASRRLFLVTHYDGPSDTALLSLVDTSTREVIAVERAPHLPVPPLEGGRRRAGVNLLYGVQ